MRILRRQQRDYNEATALFRGVEPAPPASDTPTQVLYDRAAQVSRARPDEALALFERCAEVLELTERTLRPPWVFDARAIAAGAAHRPERARVEAERAGCLNRLGRFHDARDAAERALALAGGEPHAPWRALAAHADAALALGDAPDARRCARLALSAAERDDGRASGAAARLRAAVGLLEEAKPAPTASAWVACALAFFVATCLLRAGARGAVESGLGGRDPPAG